MIHYQLRCNAQHEFDGWFKDSATFDRQAKRGLVECPVCGDAKVERAMMAPRLARKGAVARVVAEAPVPSVAAPEPVAEIASGGRMPAQMRVMLQKLRAEVEKNCDYVGPAFADEVRKIHRGESDRRGVYGETTPEQAEALADEGIEVAAIPWVPRADG
jgi:hypothetical protein